jgi:hypothetical protein
MSASRNYTVEEANALVPWLTAAFAEVQRLQALLASGVASLRGLASKSRVNGHGDLSQRVNEMSDSGDATRASLKELLASIAEKDIEVRDVSTGLVDFPGERDGRNVWLCWRPGEPAVAHWHEIDSGFASRKPL